MIVMPSRRSRMCNRRYPNRPRCCASSSKSDRRSPSSGRHERYPHALEFRCNYSTRPPLAHPQRRLEVRYAGPLKVEQFRGGQSNPTYKLMTSGSNYVLGKQPPGPSLKGTHALDHGARVLNALAVAGFPAPTLHGVWNDPAIIGTMFYVMDRSVGEIRRLAPATVSHCILWLRTFVLVALNVRTWVGSGAPPRSVPNVLTTDNLSGPRSRLSTWLPINSSSATTPA